MSETTKVHQKPEKIGEWIMEAREWLCECGARPFSGGMAHWRFDGENWQHYHGYPMGHVICQHSPLDALNAQSRQVQGHIYLESEGVSDAETTP